MDGCSLRRIVYRKFNVQLGGGAGWLGWSAGVDLECGLRGTALKELHEHIKLLLHALLAFSVNSPFPLGLLGKVVKCGNHLFVAALLLVVLIESMVLLRLHVLPCIRDVPRFDPFRAVLAGEAFAILVKRQPLPLEPRKGVFPGGVHDKRYLFNN